MPLGKQIAIGFLALPLAELVVFALVAMAVGIAGALVLMLLTSLAGALVLRHVGRSGLAQVRRAVSDPGGARERSTADGVLFGIAGILLVLPGFITDLAGALLLLGPLRRLIRATIGGATAGSRDPRRRDEVVDLAPTEWRRVGDTRTPPSGPDDGTN